MRKIILAGLLVVLAGLIQNTDLFSIWGIKSNLLLAVMIAVSLFIDSFSWYLLLVLLSVILVRFGVGFRPELLVMAFLLITAYWMRRVLPWRPSIVNCFLVAVTTILFYLLADASYLFDAPFAVAGEIVYSILFCILIYDFFRYLGDNEEQIFRR
ncbi:MAG: hypothetical protein Q8L24_02210 [bacterium]|nr:hypothetical protein [bacterium]